MNTTIADIFASGIITGTISSPRTRGGDAPTKVRIRPFVSKSGVLYQFTYTIGTHEIHKNMAPSAAAAEAEKLLNESFTQALFCTAQADWHATNVGTLKILSKPPTKTASDPVPHDRPKSSVIDETSDFLVYLGISNKSGVIKGKYDKFRQINKYIELVKDQIPIVKGRPVRIVDFGCGKAYLTFAMYHYLKNTLRADCEISGLDLKADVIEFCNKTAQALHYDNLSFQVGDIADFSDSRPIDMVITLHACDTATDAAIAKAVTWGASAIITVPCCQHELFNQINSKVQAPLLKHGILKERISALVTDASRASLLEAVGYSVDVIEFIDMEHTPKNIMIRAFKKETPKNLALGEYTAFVDEWGVSPCLRKYLDI